MAREDILSVQGGNFFVGLSSVIGLTAVPNQMNLFITAVAAGSSGLFVGGASLAVGTAGLTAGYQLSTGQILSIPYCGTLNFSAAGSTATVSYLIGLASTQGATLI